MHNGPEFDCLNNKDRFDGKESFGTCIIRNGGGEREAKTAHKKGFVK